MKAWCPRIFGLFFATCFTSTTWATDCSQETITLNSQAQVDSFQDDFGGGGICDTVTGSLVISGVDISNLDALSDLTAVGQDLDIQENDALVNIDSLSKLTGLGNDLFIGSNVLLTHIGLSNLISVSADVRILGNPLLTDLDELGNLISVGNDIFVDSNEALAQCSGLIPLLDAVDDGEPGPGPGPGGVPDVGSEIFLQDNLAGCNSIEEILNAQAELDLTKNSVTKLVTHAGQIVHYDYDIVNTSLVTLHDVNVDDDNVDAPPVCAFDGHDELAPAGNTGSKVKCTAQHTVTQQEIEVGGTLDNTATATSDEAPQVEASFSIPFGSFSDGFESAANIITSLDEYGGHGSIAIGVDGAPVISYRDTNSQTLNVAKCSSMLCTAASIAVVDGLNDTGWYSSIAIGFDGLPVISYYDMTAGALKVAHCNDAACKFGDETIVVVDDENDVGSDTSLAIGHDGMPVISYRDSSAGKLKVVKCNDALCAGGDEAISTINDSDNFTGIHTSIAIGADSFPVISYQQTSGPATTTVRVAKCNDVACTGGDETITTIDTTGIAMFESTAIAIGSDDLPVVAYFDSLGSALKFSKCNDVACDGEDEAISILDSLAASQKLSLVIDDDGLPVVAYAALRVVRCNDDACSGGDETISSVDKFGLGGSTSITIGNDGLPVISFSAPGLRVAHCGTVSCQ